MASLPDTPRLFHDLPDRDRRPLRARWWVLALAAHGVLLLLPIAWYQALDEAPRQEPVAVTIFAPPAPPETGREAPRLEEPEPAEPQAPAPRETPDAVATPDPPQEIPPPTRPPAEEIAESEPPALDVQRLLETVAAMDWSLPEESSRTLGRATESDITADLRRPVLALGENTFDGMSAPSEIEITDRWVSPGGEHNVVIRAPDGNTYCGRQAPVDDLRPWLQMPMLFHRCAGGGKRGKGRSWRNN